MYCIKCGQAVTNERKCPKCGSTTFTSIKERERGKPVEEEEDTLLGAWDKYMTKPWEK